MLSALLMDPSMFSWEESRFRHITGHGTTSTGQNNYSELKHSGRQHTCHTVNDGDIEGKPRQIIRKTKNPSDQALYNRLGASMRP
jgi:hypothetical protein